MWPFKKKEKPSKEYLVAVSIPWEMTEKDYRRKLKQVFSKDEVELILSTIEIELRPNYFWAHVTEKERRKLETLIIKAEPTYYNEDEVSRQQECCGFDEDTISYCCLSRANLAAPWVDDKEYNLRPLNFG